MEPDIFGILLIASHKILVSKLKYKIKKKRKKNCLNILKNATRSNYKYFEIKKINLQF